MKKLGIIVVLLLVTFFNTNRGEANNKIKICHNNHTIEVSMSAALAHALHGDIMRSCDYDKEDGPEQHI